MERIVPFRTVTEFLHAVHAGRHRVFRGECGADAGAVIGVIVVGRAPAPPPVRLRNYVPIP